MAEHHHHHHHHHHAVHSYAAASRTWLALALGLTLGYALVEVVGEWYSTRSPC